MLGGALAVALLLRLPGIAWGLPPVTPQVRQSDLRSSYAFDEDDILSGVAKADVKRLDFDPNEYHWGTLHEELVLLALDGAQAVGVFHTAWRAAYYNLVDRDFSRVYVVGRLVAVVAALATVWLLFQVRAGAFAAMLVAVSPSHLLQSDQVRVDVTMTALVVLTLVLALQVKSGNPKPFLVLGIAAGLAIAAKYSAISAVAVIVLAALWQQSSHGAARWRPLAELSSDSSQADRTLWSSRVHSMRRSTVT
jgi:Dolichyl-phosphate-mannose-protein mannosyltransferase